MKTRVCILDFFSGNVGSVQNLFRLLADTVVLSNEPEEIRRATHIVLPGVGAFGAAMNKIRVCIPLDVLTDEVLVGGKPFLGICVGMQVLAERGFEFGEHKGLGWISGEVRRLECKDLPIPHVGWNDVDVLRKSPLLRGLEEVRDFYFVHSYALRTRNREQVLAVTHYGQAFDSIVSQGNIFGVQFHPEKSQKAGQLLVKNFLEVTC